jgi:death-on-curing protein
MPEPVWLEMEAILALHDRSLALHGGAQGLRDPGLLESALMRPRNRFHYEGVKDIVALAASYALAVSSNHPFADGNKRTAFLSLALFLRLNGMRLAADPVDATRTMFALAAGSLGEKDLAEWVRNNSRPA